MHAAVNEKLTGKETTTVHKFQLAGLGQSPFSFTGLVTEKTFRACQGAPVQPGSSCDYCGTSIKFEFWCMSADGKEFKVGCDCIHKSGDRGLILQISKSERALRDAKNAAAKVRKNERLAARVSGAKSILPSIAGVLASQKHPSPYFADQGRTLLDYVNWCFENRAGDKASFIIEKAAGR